VKLLITGVTGFLGWRSATVLAERGHDVIGLARPGGATRAHARKVSDTFLALDAGDPAARDLVRGRDVVLHFAGVPDPARAREDPARAVRENAGTTVNLLEGCSEHGAGLIYPSTVRAADPPDAYGLSKRLGEEACRHHGADATVVRLTSVFGPGQVAWEGATGAIAAFARRALEGRPIVIPGDPERVRDFTYVDDVVGALATIVAGGHWGETITLASGRPTPLRRAAELVVAAAGADVPIETPGGDLPPGEDASYTADGDTARLGLDVRPVEDAVQAYVEWLRRHPAAQGRA